MTVTELRTWTGMADESNSYCPRCTCRKSNHEAEPNGRDDSCEDSACLCHAEVDLGDLARYVTLVDDIANRIDLAIVGDDYDLATGLDAFEVLGEAIANLKTAKDDLEQRLGERMGQHRLTLNGAGTWERHVKRAGAPKCIDEPGLWRLVKDHRQVDEATGEIMSQADVILQAYGSRSRASGELRLTGASMSKLEALGIPGALFFEKGEAIGWVLEKL